MSENDDIMAEIHKFAAELYAFKSSILKELRFVHMALIGAGMITNKDGKLELNADIIKKLKDDK